MLHISNIDSSNVLFILLIIDYRAGSIVIRFNYNKSIRYVCNTVYELDFENTIHWSIRVDIATHKMYIVYSGNHPSLYLYR